MQQMKKNLILLLILISFGFTQKRIENSKIETGWYFLAKDISKGIKVKSGLFKENIIIENRPIVTVKNFQKVKVVEREFPTITVKGIEIILDETGRKKWEKATEKMSKTGEFAIFIFENEAISKVSAYQKVENGYADVINSDLNETRLNYILKGILQEK
jgi:hypothetical protein